MSSSGLAASVLPGPPRIQIQTISSCNGRCIFCPNLDVLESGLETGRMEPGLFERIIDGLVKTPPSKILPYLQNEPLLDKRMPEFVAYIAERLPDVTTLITSNGTKLTGEMGEALIDAGLKRIKVSLQSLDDATNSKIMGYGAAKVVENVLVLKRLIHEKRSKLDLRVSMVVNTLNAEEIKEARRFWKRHGIRLVTSAMENRGGNIANAEELNLGKSMVTCSDCIRPSRDMCVLFNGKAVLCCVDWYRTVIVGDLREQSVQEVWNDAALREIREGFENQDMSKLPEICRNCTESECPNEHRRARGFWGQFKESFIAPFAGRRA